MTHRVVANAGYISTPMSAYAAYKHSQYLKAFGNYNVVIMREHEAEEHRLRLNGGIL